MKEAFTLNWNDFRTSLSSGFYEVLCQGDLLDVTLVADGQLIKAHRLVLSVCSPYFRKMFSKMPANQHAFVFLKDVSAASLKDLIQYMYCGEVSIEQDDLSAFISAAEALELKGISNEKTPKAIYNNSPFMDEYLNYQKTKTSKNQRMKRNPRPPPPASSSKRVKINQETDQKKEDPNNDSNIWPTESIEEFEFMDLPSGGDNAKKEPEDEDTMLETEAEPEPDDNDTQFDDEKLTGEPDVPADHELLSSESNQGEHDQEASEAQIEFIMTQKGHLAIKCNNYRFLRKKVSGSRAYWSCSERHTHNNCKASLNQNLKTNVVSVVNGEHNHEPYIKRARGGKR